MIKLKTAKAMGLAIPPPFSGELITCSSNYELASIMLLRSAVIAATEANMTTMEDIAHPVEDRLSRMARTADDLATAIYGSQ